MGSATGSGIDRVEVRLRRYADGRCTFLSPRRHRFVRSPKCGETGWFALELDNGRWRLNLPKRLGPGGYIAQARAREGQQIVAATRVGFRVR